MLPAGLRLSRICLHECNTSIQSQTCSGSNSNPNPQRRHTIHSLDHPTQQQSQAADFADCESLSVKGFQPHLCSPRSGVLCRSRAESAQAHSRSWRRDHCSTVDTECWIACTPAAPFASGRQQNTPANVVSGLSSVADLFSWKTSRVLSGKPASCV